MATNLALGSLVAWMVPAEKLNEGFEYLFQKDPFSGHVVIRSTDAVVAGSKFRLWTTLKVPQGYSMRKHCEFLAARPEIQAEQFRLMPAKRLFALGVGHVRRRGMEPGSKADALAEVLDTEIVELTDLDWRVLMALKREFEPDEIREDLWAPVRGRGGRFAAGVSGSRRCAQSAKSDRPIFDLPRTRQATGHRRARHEIQRTISLGRPARPRD